MSGVYTGYMCECCWNHRDIYDPDGNAYRNEMAEHERRGCACTKPGPQGARLRAGQWWDDERQRDERPGVAELEQVAADAAKVTP